MGVGWVLRRVIGGDEMAEWKFWFWLIFRRAPFWYSTEVSSNVLIDHTRGIVYVRWLRPGPVRDTEVAYYFFLLRKILL